MRRRDFVAVLASIPAAWPVGLHAAPGSDRPLIAWFSGQSEESAAVNVGAFREGLRELGYTEGENIEIVYRFGGGYEERLPAIAEELVPLKPAVIVASGVNAAVAAKKVTSTIPIVCPFLADAVRLGLVASFAHPGGNVTGITPYVEGLPGKQMEFAREIAPGANKVGLLGNMNDPKAPPQRYELEDAARSLEVNVVAPEIQSPEDLVGAVETLARERVDVVIVLQTTMLLSERRQIAALMASKRLPAVYGYREHVDDGGLISYGVDSRWCSRESATYVHKILDGTAPGDLPVEFPTRLFLVINLKTAKALGLTISPRLVALADEVIE
jgi:putative tryptophan/tyrosine transport system substrate-binding protein